MFQIGPQTVVGPDSTVLQLAWNPVVKSSLALVFSNGSAGIITFSSDNMKAKPDVCTLPPAMGIKCVSWSPKGKQLVAGNFF